MFIYRYAFSPLIDAADDEDEEDETVLNDAFGMLPPDIPLLSDYPT